MGRVGVKCLVEMLLAVWAALLQDPRDRLLDAIKESRHEDAKIILGHLAAGDGARAARGLISALPKSRDRIALLLRGSVGARQDYDRIDTSFSFNLEEEKVKTKALRQSKERIKEANARAIDAERIHEALLASFAGLREGAAEVLAGEAERTGSWILKCELYEGLGLMKADQQLLAALEREKEPAAQATILHGLGTAGGIEYLRHPQWQLCLGALRSVLATPEGIGAVIETLAAADARYRMEAFAALSRVTRTELPPDAAVWQDWWKANGAAFLAGRYRPELRQEAAGPGRTSFYGIPIRSSRVCFVIDRSGSMAEGDRFAAAVKELKRLLDELPDGALINILCFGGTVSQFARTTRPLDRTARKDAAQFIDRQGLESGTDLYRALEKALTFVGSPEIGSLREDGVDTIVVLSDGMSTVGKLVDDELVGRVIARRARYLRPVIHTVSLGNDSASLQFLSKLTGGEYRRP